MPLSKLSKPLLVGENNPYGSDPDFALYPAPDGCAGHRLCCWILGMRRTHYLDSFDRTNLCAGRWDFREAEDAALNILASGRRHVIMLGRKVASAFGTRLPPFCRCLKVESELLALPHPSGRCRVWNEDRASARARLAVTTMCPWLTEVVGRTDC